MKNAQGQDEKLINVNIMDVPTEPLNVFVDNVFQDNCVVHWSKPKDDGGTEIKKYIVEVHSCNLPAKYHIQFSLNQNKSRQIGHAT